MLIVIVTRYLLPSNINNNNNNISIMHKPLTDVHVLREADEDNYADKDDQNFLTNHLKRQYMRGISTTTSQAGGVYYEALKGSSNSLVKGWVIVNYEKILKKKRKQKIFKFF